MVTGQVGAVQLGIGRALQNWEPDLRPPLRSGITISEIPFSLLLFHLCHVLTHCIWHVWFWFYSLVVALKLVVQWQWFYPWINFCAAYSLCVPIIFGVISWVLDKGSTCGWKEEARKSKSKKELSMGQTLINGYKLAVCTTTFCMETWYLHH